MDVLQWDGLTFLGSGLVQQLRSVYQHPFYLANSFDSEEEARETLSQLMSSVDDVELLDECARRLFEQTLQTSFGVPDSVYTCNIEYNSATQC